ncbi:hypothetical protein SDC9_150686 [bioreactor metagenome]|uniref:Uncharacterized protein n=1 Tax=bioreactor metagenome TaxID=1076179 RepID=A0A645EPT3_9ZZZZ
MQQGGVGQPLLEGGACRNRIVFHPAVGDGGGDDGQADGRKVGHCQAQVTLPDQRQRRSGERLAVGRQAAGSQKAGDDQEYLNGHAPVLEEPVENRREIVARCLGQRAVGRKMIHQDEHGCNGLQGVDQRHAVGVLAHGGDIILIVAVHKIVSC